MDRLPTFIPFIPLLNYFFLFVLSYQLLTTLTSFLLLKKQEVYYVGTESKRESDILEQIGIEHQFTPSASVK